MNQMLYIILACVFLPIGIYRVARAGDQSVALPTLPEEMRLALKRNAEAVDRVVVDWTYQRTPRNSANAVMQAIGGEIDAGFFFQPGGERLSRIGERFRVVKMGWSRSGGTYSEAPTLLTFDGTLVYIGSEEFVPGAQVRNKQLCTLESPENLSRTAPDGKLFYGIYFDAAGIKEFNTGATFTRRPVSLAMWLIDEGGIVDSVADTNWRGRRAIEVAIRTGGTRVVFRLDPTLQFAVLAREEYSSDGRISHRVENEDFQEIKDPSVWLPRHCRIEWYSWWTNPSRISHTPLFIEELRAESTRVFGQHDGDFSIDYKHHPGVMIADRTLPEAVTRENGAVDYYVPADPGDLESAIDAAVKNKKFEPRIRYWTTRVVLVNLAIAVLVLAGVLALRRRAIHRKDG